MNKPSFTTAPSWANYLAMDKGGCWFWYEVEPVPGECSWRPSRGKIANAGYGPINWQHTLEKRDDS